MDPISPTNAGVVSSKTTPAAPETAAPAPGVPDGRATASASGGPFAAAPAAAGSAAIPEPPGGTPDPGLGQEVLDRAFAQMEKLEKELKSIDPTTPEGAKRMAEITRQLNRVDEMIRMVNEMRRSRHEANMAVIDNIA
jgi:hypothetical protein